MIQQSHFSDSLRFDYIIMKLDLTSFLLSINGVGKLKLFSQWFHTKKISTGNGAPTDDFIFIILQYMYKYNMYESAQNLEQESKVYFNMETFTVMIKDGHWEKVYKYLCSFIHPNDCYHSMMIFWKIGRERYLEALDQKDFVKALSVLAKDLKPLWFMTSKCTTELPKLIFLENFREKEEYAQYGDTKTMREKLVVELVDMLKHHPIIKEILSFPRIDISRLETLLSQSVDWQHLFCHYAVANPAAMSTLFADHACERSPSLTPHKLVFKDPYENDQSNGAGPSAAPCLNDLNFSPWVSPRP